MAFKVQIRQFVDGQKRPIGRWRMTVASDADDVEGPLCKCDGGPGLPGHATWEDARTCKAARARLKIEPFKGKVRIPRAKKPKQAKKPAEAAANTDAKETPTP